MIPRPKTLASKDRRIAHVAFVAGAILTAIAVFAADVSASENPHALAIKNGDARFDPTAIIVDGAIVEISDDVFELIADVQGVIAAAVAGADLFAEPQAASAASIADAAFVFTVRLGEYGVRFKFGGEDGPFVRTELASFKDQRRELRERVTRLLTGESLQYEEQRVNDDESITARSID